MGGAGGDVSLRGISFCVSKSIRAVKSQMSATACKGSAMKTNMPQIDGTALANGFLLDRVTALQTFWLSPKTLCFVLNNSCKSVVFTQSLRNSIE